MKKGNSIDMKELEPIARPLLPIIFVLDTSGSMEGQPISMLNHTMEEVINILGNFAASNPDALLKIGLLQVHSGAHWIQPKGLEEFGDFYNPLTARGLTEMGAALRNWIINFPGMHFSFLQQEDVSQLLYF